MKSVAIVGGFAAGKTTLASGLMHKFGYRKLSLAAPIKALAADAFNGGEPLEKEAMYEVHPLDLDLPMMMTGRRIFQELGQSVKSLDRNFWIRLLMRDIHGAQFEKWGMGPFVVDDCRFPYEADALGEAGFVIIRLDVPLEVRIARYRRSYGQAPAKDALSHPSEVEMSRIEEDITINAELPPEEVLNITANYLAGLDH